MFALPRLRLTAKCEPKDSLQLFRLILTSPFHVALPPLLVRKVLQMDFGWGLDS